MTALVILGAGGHGRVVADIAEACGYGQISFLDDRWPEIIQSGAWRVTGSGTADEPYALGIGDNQTRLRLLEATPGDPVTLVHPSAVVSPHAQLGAGCVICAGAVVGAFARLGPGSIVNTSASVDHDCDLEAGVHISPGARLGGGVSVGSRSWIGIGAAVREYTRLGTDTVIGAGAAVIRDVPDNTRMGGVPAKELGC